MLDVKSLDCGGQCAHASRVWSTAGDADASHGGGAGGANVDAKTGTASVWNSLTTWSYRCALSDRPRSPYDDIGCRSSTIISDGEKKKKREKEREGKNGLGCCVVTYDDEAISCKNSSSDSFLGSASLLFMLLPR